MNFIHRELVWREFMSAALMGLVNLQDAKHADGIATVAGQFADAALKQYEQRQNVFRQSPEGDTR